MSTRRQRIRNYAYNTIWADNSGSTADRDTDCDDYSASANISLSQLGNSCPQLKSDCLA